MSLLNKFFKEADKKAAISWAFYDFANSAYALLILSFVFPIYFKEVVVGAERGDFYWGLLVSVSILIGGLLAPIIGAIADYYSRQKIKFIIFLARVSTKETVGRISGMAWGLGYIGGVVAMLAFRPLYENGYVGDFEFGYKLVFPLTALFFLLFSIPSFIFIKEKSENKNRESLSVLIKHGIKSVVGTIKNLKQHKNIAWFLLGFYFMNDALVTIFSFI